MSRKEFMEQLEKLLVDIPQEERIEALAYYNGYFEDAGVENEESIIQELESPEKVAKIIKADIGIEEEKEYTENGYEDTRFHQQEEVGSHTGSPQEGSSQSGYNADFQETSAKKEDKTLKIVLLVLVAVVTSPVWLGILGTAAGVLLGVLGAILGVLLAIAVTVIAFYIVGFVLAGVGIGMFPVGSFAAGAGLIGSGLLMLALAVLGTIGCVWLFGRFLPWLVKGTIKLCSRPFQRKGRVA